MNTLFTEGGQIVVILEAGAYDAHDVTGELFDGDADLTRAAKPREVYDGGLGIFVRES